MTISPLHLLLADDDLDDCFLFKEALDELTVSAILTTVNNGVQLIQVLSAKEAPLPAALFLDLNLPLKNGFECLAEIKLMDKLLNLPVIIYSTSLNWEVIDELYENGALFYVRKPGEFDKLKKVLSEAITLISQNKISQLAREKFILNP